MPGERIPIIILGGSDRRPVRLPQGVSDKHPLSGPKGVAIRFGGRPLIATIVERLEACGWFAPIYIAGPAAVYSPVRTAARLVDTAGSFGENIEAALEAVHAANPGKPVAFTTCDILPEVETLRAMHELYAEQAPVDMWFPVVRLPADRSRLGESAWKPTYRIVPHPGEPAEEILPGHLVVVDPDALRRKFIYRLFDIAYRTRNRPIEERQSKMIRRLMLELLYQDFLHMLGLRLPTLTYTILRAAVPTARLLRTGEVTRARLEKSLRKMFVKYRFRRRHPRRRIHLPIVDALSLALDFDTEEEARQMGGDVAPEPTPTDADPVNP